MNDGGEYGSIPPSGVKSYRWMRLPWWARGAVAGLAFGIVFVVGWPVDDSNAVGRIVGSAFGGVLFGIGMGLFVRAWERRIFQADGRVLTPDERIAVLQAADARRWPDDTRLHTAVSRVAEQRLRRSEKPAFKLAFFGLMVALALINVVINGPWWWWAVAFWIIASPWQLRIGKRHRASAQALRAAAPAGPRS